MSADNWAECPRCARLAGEETALRHRAAEEAYGVVPLGEYKALEARAEERIVPEHEYPLREDYEVGIDEDGCFYASYKARCATCDFSHEFKHQEPTEEAAG